ncbi:MAG: hypothetical protein KDD56_02395 [Bdellovibrionales bacterium]|nr:hypothetical protein [Bdellovibrionales bacterium]
MFSKPINFYSFCLIIFCSILVGCVAASTNNNLSESSVVPGSTPSLPAVELADLNGQVYEFPKDLPASQNVLVLGFSHEQKDSTQSWMAPLAELETKYSNLSVFKVPVIDNKNAALRTIIRNGMRSGSEEGARSKTLTLFVDSKKLIEHLGITDTDQVSVVLLNSNGQVEWLGKGSVNDGQLSGLTKVLKSKSNVG